MTTGADACGSAVDPGGAAHSMRISADFPGLTGAGGDRSQTWQVSNERTTGNQHGAARPALAPGLPALDPTTRLVWREPLFIPSHQSLDSCEIGEDQYGGSLFDGVRSRKFYCSSTILTKS